MPNCPNCGKEVQASTTYCPNCGANLKQGYAQPTMPTGSYSSSPAYPQQGPGFGYQPHEQSHSHRKYIIAIIAVALIGLIAGGLLTEAFLVPPDVTDTTGMVTLNTTILNTYHGSASQILFGSADTGNLSSTVFSDHSYQAYLPIGETYTVIIQWTNVTGSSIGTYSCTASPMTFSSSNANQTRNFAC